MIPQNHRQTYKTLNSKFLNNPSNILHHLRLQILYRDSSKKMKDRKWKKMKNEKKTKDKTEEEKKKN